MVNISKIKEIEAMAYPPQFCMMQDCMTIEDLADYCEVSVKNLIVIEGEGWYAIIGKHGKRKAEFVDIAKIPGTPMIPWPIIIGKLASSGIKRINADMRVSTSYKVLRRFGVRLGISILKEKTYTDEDFGEEMVEVVLAL